MSIEFWIGVAVAVAVPFSVYFLQRRDRKKEKAEEEKEHEGMNLADINFTIPAKEKTNSSTGVARTAARIVEDLKRQNGEDTNHFVKFEITEKYQGYRTELTYRNVGNACARFVKVTVNQDENENLSKTVIVNNGQFPIFFLMPGDRFYIDVDCYYPKTYREFHIQWEDSAGFHDEAHKVLLSKNYAV